jgi:Lipase C-terminal domain/Lipase (class 2)
MKLSQIAVFLLLILLVLAFAVVSCGDDDDDDDDSGDDDDGADDDDDAADDDDNDDDTSGPSCDETKLPIVYVHGMIDAGDNFALPAMRFASNGYCMGRIFAFDWNTVSLDNEVQIQNLTAFINQVLETTGEAQIDLIGHSAGGGISVTYLEQKANSDKIAHYIHAASFDASGLPGGVPTLTLSSADDAIAGLCNIPGAQNVELIGADHVQVVTSVESFEQMYAFFNNGQSPVTTEIVPETEVSISGKILSLGENIPSTGYQVEIYEVDPANGERYSETPDFTLTPDTTGTFGPVDVDPGAYYELYGIPDSPDLIPVHYYRQPFVRSNNLVYMRSFPGAGSLVGLFLRTIPYDDDYAVPITFTANQAVVYGRDTLEVDGYDLSTPEMISAEQSTIAIFFYDGNDNQTTDAGPVGGLIDSMPFLTAYDLVIPSSPDRSIPLELNGVTMNVPNRGSKTDGVVIAVFD